MENLPIENINRISDMIVGETYNREQINDVFKCSVMGGMNRSTRTNSLVLIANHTDNTYIDEWDENGILNYTGEGRKGDQNINARQNKTLNHSNDTDIKVYLFEVYEETKYIYVGEVVLVKAPYQEVAPDEDGKDRIVWKFPIAKKDGTKPISIPHEVWEKNIKNIEKQVRKLSDSEIEEKLLKTELHPKKIARRVETKQIKRNPIVIEKTIRRAKNRCDLCEKEAPFYKKNKEPFLEVHHLIRLADDGPDHIYNTVALCPNCHRKMHILKEKKDFEKLKSVIYQYLISEKKEEYIKEFEGLFYVRKAK